VLPQQPPRVATPIQQLHPPTPLPTPRKLNFDNVSPPRVVDPQRNAIPAQRPPRSPIVTRSRSRMAEPLVGPKVTPLALNASAGPYHHQVKYMVPTLKSVQPSNEYMDFAGLCQAMAMNENDVERLAGLCQALQDAEPSLANAVLDPSSGEFLEHCQLRKDPQYKTV